MWGCELLAECGEWVEMVGLCDMNPMRAERARELVELVLRISRRVLEPAG